MERVAGYCPMGCGETLFLGKGGHVTCSFIECPNPVAADEILHERETEHIVRISDDDFSITHPLRERIDGELHRCQLHQDLSGLGGPPMKPGMYRVLRHRADPVSESYRPGSIPWDFIELEHPLPA